MFNANTRNVLEIPFMSVSAKIVFFCKFMAKLGFAHPTEEIAQHCVVTLWAIVAGVDAIAMSGPQKLAVSKDF